jgi:hypothetical protein
MVCHRMVTRYKPTSLSKISSYQFSDGTTLDLTVRPARRREQIKCIRGYDQLLDVLVAHGLTGNVRHSDLDAARAKERERMVSNERS